MNKTYAQSVSLAQQVSYECSREELSGVEVLVCPGFISLKGVRNVFDMDGAPVSLGAQDVYTCEQGAFTGEIAPSQLTDVGCSYCIVGHSERRQLLGESNDLIAQKVNALFTAGITPVLCCGEPLEVYEADQGKSYVTEQIASALAEGVPEDKDIVVAYEPIWAIGTGKVATPEYAQDICAEIRSELARRLGDEKAQQIRILYGGSVQPQNSKLFFEQPDIDGALIGGAALDKDSFAEIIQQARTVARG